MRTNYKEVKKLHLPLMLAVYCIFFSNVQLGNAQTYTSYNNYTGSWEANGSWTNGSSPGAYFNSDEVVAVFGELSTSSDLFFNKGELQVNDTLVVNGNIGFGNNGDLSVTAGGVLIILGDMDVGNKVNIAAGGTIIIQGNVDFQGSANQGSFTSDQYPAQVYIGGTISGNPPTSATPPAIPVVDCDASVEHSDTQCNYGNLSDLEEEEGNEDISDYYQEVVCGGGIDPGTIGSDQNICAGDDAALLTEISPSTESIFRWFYSVDSVDPDVPTWIFIAGEGQTTYDPGVLTQTTSYYRQVQKGNGCTANSNAITITVDTPPSPVGVYHD